MSQCGNTSNVITSRYYGMEIHPLLCLLLRNSTGHNRVKSNKYVNHGNDETQTQIPLIPRGKHCHFGCADQNTSTWVQNLKRSFSLFISVKK